MRRPYFKKTHQAWYCNIGGKQVRLGKDKEAAEKEYHRLMAAEIPVTSRTSAAQLIDQFLHWTKENRDDTTFRWYQRYLKSFVLHIGYKLKVNDLKPIHVHRWLERSFKLSGQADKNGGCRAVARAFNWAKKAGLITASPVDGMERPSPVSRECYLSPKQWAEVVALYKAGDPFLDLIWFLHETGARIGEARVVSAKHFDRQQKWFVLKLKESKGKKRKRVIRLNAKALAICERLILKNPDGPIFLNRNGKPWTAFSVTNRFSRLRAKLKKQKQKAGTWEQDKEWVAFVFPHALRHTFVTDALLRGVDPLSVSILVGHKTPDLVMKVYSHLTQQNAFLADKLKQATGEIKHNVVGLPGIGTTDIPQSVPALS